MYIYIHRPIYIRNLPDRLPAFMPACLQTLHPSITSPCGSKRRPHKMYALYIIYAAPFMFYIFG